MHPEHLRFQPRQAVTRLLHCLLLDCSTSMLHGDKLALAKGVLLHCARDAYRQRAELAVVGFAGQHAWLIHRPGRTGANHSAWISPIPGGGGSPVQQGLALAEQLIRDWRKRHHPGYCNLWLLSDGRFSNLPARPTAPDHCLVVDFENDAIALGRAARLAEDWGAEYRQAWHATPGR